MPSVEQLVTALGWCIVICPIVLLCVLGLTSLIGRRLPEEVINGFLKTAMIVGLTSSILMLALMLPMSNPHVTIEGGKWVHIPEYEFQIGRAHV